MPITYTVDVEAGLLLVTWIGPIGVRELDEFSTTILADPRIATCCRSITDVRESEILLTSEELRIATERLFARAVERGKIWKTAVVVSRPLHFGVARQHEMISANLKTTAVFSNEPDARAWVMAD